MKATVVSVFRYRGHKLVVRRGRISFNRRLAALFHVQPFVWLRAVELPHHVRVWTAHKIRQAIRTGKDGVS